MPRPEDRGPQMLRVLMTNDIDFSPLRKEGISEAGIDLVSRLLNRDPHSRPKERECFAHSWIADVVDVDEYEDDPCYSDGLEELPVIGEDPAEELDASQLSLNDNSGANDSGDEYEIAQSKRPRIGSPPTNIRYPSLPDFESIQEPQSNYKPSPNRLFGEITPSVLQSSNVLGAAPVAFEDDGLSFADLISSTGESIVSGGNSINSVLSLPENPFGGSAPSLMGAENMVGQLNMNTTWHPGTPTDHPPVGTPVRRPSPGDLKESTGNRDSQTNEKANSIDATPKASRFNRRINLRMPDIDQENYKGDSNGKNNGRHDNFETIPGQIFDIELATTLDAQNGREGPREARPRIAEHSRESGGLEMPQVVTSSQFSKPRPVLGKLSTMPGSIANMVIRLEDRMTSWGRGPRTTVRYPDEMDSRIPLYALEITFWAPGLEAKITSGEDWLKVPGVMAILSTKTREHIWVNDTKLWRGSRGANGEEFHFGKLYSGDIITVYRDHQQFVKFQCEFFHGDSARARPENEKPFIVQKRWTSRPPSKKSSDGEDSERSGKSGKSEKSK